MKNKILKFFLSVGGVGYFPKAPGTAASILACLIFPLFNSFIWFSIIFGALLLVSLVWGNQCLKNKSDDPSWIVMDELLGQWLTLAPLFFIKDFSFGLIIVGLLLFRFFDISKIAGIKKIEQMGNIKAVIFDDLLAGIYGGIILFGIIVLVS